MRNRLLALFMAAAVGLTVAPQVTNGQRASRGGDDFDYPESEEINQSYELAPGARVELSVIAGPVEVVTSNSNTAEVHIVRSAATRAELDCYEIAIEHTPSSLTLRHKQLREGPCRNIRSRQRVTLRLPRNVDLKMSAVSGPVKVGEVDGSIHLSGISGKVEVEQAEGYSELSGISGVLIVNVNRLSERGIRVSGISGRVEIRLADSLNADITVSGINGDVDAAARNVTLNKINAWSFRGKVGAGGALISVSGISGNVVFRGA